MLLHEDVTSGADRQLVTLMDLHCGHHGEPPALVGVCVNRIGKCSPYDELGPTAGRAHGK